MMTLMMVVKALTINISVREGFFKKSLLRLPGWLSLELVPGNEAGSKGDQNDIDNVTHQSPIGL